MEYDFKAIESKWQAWWASHKTFKAVEDPSRPKYYVLDMFPYPSGAGLHVGHPLGYIASDIYSRYKRLKGFNVLHPMGYDAFGLPAEQYAIQTGQHPEKTTTDNIARYRSQLDRIGFSYDWDREVRTCDPEFYKWTQWAFLKMFESWYDPVADKARPISELVKKFETEGYEDVTPAAWVSASEKEKSDILMRYRIAYQGETSVNWCEGLGTVLANDEVKDGLSVRGGFPVEQKKMTQWQLRVSAYASRLLESLDRLDWSDSLKEMQRNWIGRSDGTEVVFETLCDGRRKPVTIFTTRVDTIFGVTFMVLAPESELVDELTSADRREAVAEYIKEVKKKTERERIAETKSVTGVFAGSYGINPLTGEQIPIWISEYVLAGYGTGAIMAVPAHDSRDYAFARKFDLPIVPIIEGCDVSEASFDAKEGKMCNSGFLDGMDVKDAIEAAMDYVEQKGLGRRKTNFRLRDAIFSRQRYWGEPFPIYYKDGIPCPVAEKDLPLRLPEIDSFKPTGEAPLARAKDWTYNGYPLETSTMPGFAGSSAYYLRYMDPHDNQALVSRDANEYWRSVDL
ncbi:MAG: leucine--tRNA ligase, partial [Bacteroidales bacterium]|nr:leucine--tRNA ligase [Bacteroidales bacterium]